MRSHKEQKSYKENFLDDVFEDYIDRNLLYEEHTGLIWWACKGSNSRNTEKPVGARISSGHLSVSLCPKGGGRKVVLVHRLAWRIYYGHWPDHLLDHINGDPTDNRLANLREADAKQNIHNSVDGGLNSTGYRGVQSQSNGRFRARYTEGGVRKSLGTFTTAKEASDAYEEKIKDLYEDFYRDCI